MKIGRTGVFTTSDGNVGVAAVVALHQFQHRLVAKEVNSGQLIEFERGEFHTFDSCGYNPNAANIVRNRAGVSEGGREILAESIEATPLAQFSLGAGVAAPTADALELAARQIRNKKRVTAIPASLAAFLRPFFRSGKGKVNLKVKATARGKAKTAKV
jgi:hypothetical protein